MDPTGWQGLQVLIVEPEEPFAARLADGLRLLGARVGSAPDGRSALAHLRGHPADAVVLAAPLPDSDWTALAAWILQEPAAPVLLVLAPEASIVAAARCWPQGRSPDAVLERDAKPEEVFRALEAAASLRSGGSASDAQTANLPALLVEIRDRADTGVLEIRAEGLCTRIFFRRGEPLFAEGGALRETLGRMLLQRGALTDLEYLHVIDRMTERLMDNETTRMGEVLVELGLMTAAEVFAALSEQVREKIVGCFHWEHFVHQFEPDESTPEELSAYPSLPLEPLLLAGLRAHYGPDRLEPILAPFADRRPALIEDLATLTARFQFSAVEQRVLRLLGREHTLATVRAIAPTDAVRAAQMLAALLLSRNLEWHDERAARRETRGPKPCRPANVVPPPTPSTPAPAPAASAPASATAPVPISALSSARRAASPRSLATLRNTLARAGREIAAPLDPRTAQLEAERAFRQGLLCLEHAAPAGALRAFGRACALRGDEPEYRMYEAWAALLAADDDEARTVARGKATVSAQLVLKRDRESVHAHGILGQILLATGDVDAAGTHFRAVLRKSPEDRDAQRGLWTIDRRRAGGG